MAGIPSDYTIIGTVLAIAVAIILLSGLALYVAFRVRETMREEKGKGARTVKVAFMIGLLFLSGGVFYFFASGFNSAGVTSQGTSITSSTSAASTSTTTSTSSTTSTTTTSSTSSTTNGQGASMAAPSCAGKRVSAGSSFTCTLTIFNSGGTTFSGATLVSGGDFTKFTFLSCSEQVNGGSTTSVPTSASSASIGDLPPGTIVLNLVVQAPTQQGQDSNSMLTLNAVGFSQPITVTFTIQVTA